MPAHHRSSRSASPRTTNRQAVSHVRIIGGDYRRRQIGFVDGDGLRPTPDRVRETLFNWLQDAIVGMSVLDCCAGSGVLGFEALSRGARHVTMIEPNRAQFSQLVASQQQLAISDTHLTLLPSTAEHALADMAMQAAPAFGGVFLDPPYRLDLWQPLLRLLLDNALINADSWLYIESDRPQQTSLAPALAELQVLKYKKMGQVFAGLYQIKGAAL